MDDLPEEPIEALLNDVYATVLGCLETYQAEHPDVDPSDLYTVTVSTLLDLLVGMFESHGADGKQAVIGLLQEVTRHEPKIEREDPKGGVAAE